MAIVVLDALDTGLPDEAHEGLLRSDNAGRAADVALLLSWDLGFDSARPRCLSRWPLQFLARPSDRSLHPTPPNRSTSASKSSRSRMLVTSTAPSPVQSLIGRSLRGCPGPGGPQVGVDPAAHPSVGLIAFSNLICQTVIYRIPLGGKCMSVTHRPAPTPVDLRLDETGTVELASLHVGRSIREEDPVGRP